MIEEGCDFHDSSLNTYNLDFIIEYLYLKTTVNDEVNHFGKNLVGMPSTIADTANPYGSQLPDIVVINLSYSNIELVANPAGYGLQYLPLTLERHISRQAKTDLTYANIHMTIENLSALPENRFHL